MIKKYNEYINENLLDKMTPKSDEELDAALKGYGPSNKLLLACSKGLLWLVKDMVEARVDINRAGSYALELAIYNGHIDIVQYLIDSGSYIYPRFLDTAREVGQYEILDYLQQHMRTNENLLDKMTAKSDKELDLEYGNILKKSTRLDEYSGELTPVFQEMSNLMGESLNNLYYLNEEHADEIWEYFADYLEDVSDTKPTKILQKEILHGQWYCYPHKKLAWWGYGTDDIIGWVFNKKLFKQTTNENLLDKMTDKSDDDIDSELDIAIEYIIKRLIDDHIFNKRKDAKEYIEEIWDDILYVLFDGGSVEDVYDEIKDAYVNDLLENNRSVYENLLDKMTAKSDDEINTKLDVAFEYIIKRSMDDNIFKNKEDAKKYIKQIWQDIEERLFDGFSMEEAYDDIKDDMEWDNSGVYENLLDKMTAKSEEELEDAIKNISPLDIMGLIWKGELSKDFTPPKEDILKALKNDYQSLEQQLIYGVKNNHYGIVKHTLDKGADIHFNDEEPVLWATVYNRVGMLILLLKNGGIFTERIRNSVRNSFLSDDKKQKIYKIVDKYK